MSNSPFPPPVPGPFDSRGGYAPPPPPPPRRRSWSIVGAIVTAVLVVVFAGSILLNLGLFAAVVGIAAAAGGADGVHRDALVDGDANQKIAVVPVEGVITDPTAKKVGKIFDALDKEAGVKAVILRVDTPGGTVTASDEIYRRVLRFKAGHANVPVVVSMGGYATSGGYYVSCAGDYLLAEETTTTGNIGVLLPRYNFSGLMQKYGVDDVTTVSTGTPFKDAGSPTAPERPEAAAYLQHLVDVAFGEFKGVVATGRAGKLKDTVDHIANGKAYPAQDALDLGLVDQKGDLYAAEQYVAGKLALSKPNVVRYDKPGGVLSALLSSDDSSQSPLSPVRAAVGRAFDGQLPDVSRGGDMVQSGRLLYLWHGY